MDEYFFVQISAPYEIVEFMRNIFLIYEIRGKVGSQYGVKFIVHSVEQNHVVPHIHAEYGEYQISIAIADQKILAGNLPQKQQKVAQQWVREHREELLSKWSSMAISAISSMTRSGLDWEK